MCKYSKVLRTMRLSYMIYLWNHSLRLVKKCKKENNRIQAQLRVAHELDHGPHGLIKMIFRFSSKSQIWQNCLKTPGSKLNTKASVIHDETFSWNCSVKRYGTSFTACNMHACLPKLFWHRVSRKRRKHFYFSWNCLARNANSKKFHVNDQVAVEIGKTCLVSFDETVSRKTFHRHITGP